ncbi:hypothetical protein SFRURICE_015413 [Spodoptera frugiperda]|uniref:SFRICE_038823 n=1 Tax=Spodoptera frugiperda TaxID=7108 RepID=A0A2H1V7X7_SPOFR|nr:hypothetical protein SFRURICE_015413 [Spodoptera frugiperda]
MSGAGVASRTASEPVSLPAELPVRLYMRALRQYQKLLDLRRLSSKDKALVPGTDEILKVGIYKLIGYKENIIIPYVKGPIDDAVIMDMNPYKGRFRFALKIPTLFDFAGQAADPLC